MDNTLSRRAQRTIAYGFLFFILISMATPFVWMISNTFKEQYEIFQLRPTLIPEEPHLRHYFRLFAEFELQKHFLNTPFIAVVHPASHLSLPSLPGFAFAYYNFPPKDLPFLLLLGSMMAPPYTIFLAAQPGIADAAGRDGGHAGYVSDGTRRRDGGVPAFDLADSVAFPRFAEAVPRRADGGRDQVVSAREPQPQSVGCG